MTTYTDAQQTLPVQTEVDHGVLVATIHTKSLLYEMAINEIEECILEAMPRAQSALLVDCAELTLHVSSQFLSMLVRVHRKAGESGLKMGICNLSEALQMVYNVTARCDQSCPLITLANKRSRTWVSLTVGNGGQLASLNRKSQSRAPP